MTYTPPSGWVEDPYEDPTMKIRTRFHIKRDCPRVSRPETLRAVDRPFSAVRCPFCAAA